mmetsp:Transcript_5776/g.6640  ORF Transcript_5776/g.6640 Transcript_5776/m.6640 type:complete len:197 (+) Transcript_5776:237-827(+)|eukprot:CAMPEP_0197851282 /NCGR_PEP_ID=MMETSP1438-20131217/17717_1 /TAXON_ID=1461541 /ORGANISM="Pterosperma sp., Strain CCMP1384" /LENGTH=196 /DNA_ID=CAMNT_0043464831 /DNA_START=237 /DNA_END=827 /DNA_ORIENTATION=+
MSRTSAAKQFTAVGRLLLSHAEESIPVSRLTSVHFATTRGFASSSESQFVKDRRAYKKELGELRKEFKVANDYATKLRDEARQKKLQENLARQQEEKKARQANKTTQKEINLAKEAALKQHKAEIAERTLACVRKRKEQLQYFRDVQVVNLLDDSRYWVREEDLDIRINHALDNPEPVFPGDEEFYHHPEDIGELI